MGSSSSRVQHSTPSDVTPNQKLALTELTLLSERILRDRAVLEFDDGGSNFGDASMDRLALMDKVIFLHMSMMRMVKKAETNFQIKARITHLRELLRSANRPLERMELENRIARLSELQTQSLASYDRSYDGIRWQQRHYDLALQILKTGDAIKRQAPTPLQPNDAPPAAPPAPLTGSDAGKQLSLDELQRRYESLRHEYEIHEREAMNVGLRLLDRTRSGAVVPADVPSLPTALFLRLDRNRNGKISERDLQYFINECCTSMKTKREQMLQLQKDQVLLAPMPRAATAAPMDKKAEQQAAQWQQKNSQIANLIVELEKDTCDYHQVRGVFQRAFDDIVYHKWGAHPNSFGRRPAFEIRHDLKTVLDGDVEQAMGDTGVLAYDVAMQGRTAAPRSVLSSAAGGVAPSSSSSSSSSSNQPSTAPIVLGAAPGQFPTPAMVTPRPSSDAGMMGGMGGIGGNAMAPATITHTTVIVQEAMTPPSDSDTPVASRSRSGSMSGQSSSSSSGQGSSFAGQSAGGSASGQGFSGQQQQGIGGQQGSQQTVEPEFKKPGLPSQSTSGSTGQFASGTSQSGGSASGTTGQFGSGTTQSGSTGQFASSGTGQSASGSSGAVTAPPAAAPGAVWQAPEAQRAR